MGVGGGGGVVMSHQLQEQRAKVMQIETELMLHCGKEQNFEKGMAFLMLYPKQKQQHILLTLRNEERCFQEKKNVVEGTLSCAVTTSAPCLQLVSSSCKSQKYTSRSDLSSEHFSIAASEFFI